MSTPLRDPLDDIWKALADPLRRRLLILLNDSRYFCKTVQDSVHGICVQDLSRYLGVPQSTVSRHLAILARADLVVQARWKTWHYYAVNHEQVGAARTWLQSLEKVRSSEEESFAAPESFGSPAAFSLEVKGLPDR